jgi:hypothetical protein
MNKQTVYLETTIISYFTAFSSRDIIIAGHQQITVDWFKNYSKKYGVYSSELVVLEASSGDPSAAKKRLSLIENIKLIEINEHVLHLAKEFIRSKVVPERYNEDALHIAAATIHGIDYLMTWNCKHIANAQIQKKLRMTANMVGYELPIICTPEELM